MTQLNGTTLAYIGDAVYELYIREFFIHKGFTKVDDLHKKAIEYTSAEGQKIALDKITEYLSEEELSYYKRGRNASSLRRARNADLATYQQATGFESLIGYLYIEKNTKRIEELLEIILQK